MSIIDLIENYSIKKSDQIKKICAPLTQLGIPYLWYYFVENDGSFGAISNDPDYSSYYMTSKMHLNVPYYAHPSYFRSGCTFMPSAFKSDYPLIKKNFAMDHTFVILKSYSTGMEGFSFYEREFNDKKLPYYLNNLDLLHKFICYFKRETRQLVIEQKNCLFNIKNELGEKFFRVDEGIALTRQTAQVKSFLKEVYGLSPQEERCLELLKQGYTAQGTASILNISNRTVETHINNIKIKLKCNSKLELLNN